MKCLRLHERTRPWAADQGRPASQHAPARRRGDLRNCKPEKRDRSNKLGGRYWARPVFGLSFSGSCRFLVRFPVPLSGPLTGGNLCSDRLVFRPTLGAFRRSASKVVATFITQAKASPPKHP